MNPLLVPEIVEHIFLFLDGKSIFNCGSVCRLWKDIVDNIPHNSLVWQNCCRDVHQDVFEEFSRTIYPSYWLWENNVDYRELYESWLSLAELVSPESTPLTLEIESHVETMRCIAVSGCVLYCGHSTGEITVLCLCGALLCADMRYLHYGAVLKLEPMCHPAPLERTSANHEFLVSMYSSRYIILFEFDGRGELLEVDRVRWAEAPIDICVYRNSLCVVTLHSCEMCKINFCDGKARIVINEIPKANFSPLNPLETFWTWGALVCGISSLLRFYKDEEKHFVFSAVKRGPHVQPVLQMYFWRPMVAVWLTAKRTMYCCVGDSKVKEYSPCEVMMAFRTHPVSICLCGMIFIVGTSTGDIYAYNLKCYEDLLSLDLEKYGWTSHLGHDAVSSIAVTFTAGEPVIVALLESEICVLSFNSRASSRPVCKHTIPGTWHGVASVPFVDSGFRRHLMVPEVIVFDLDHTLWPFKVGKDFIGPFTRRGEDIVDGKGKTVPCFPEAKQTLCELRDKGFPVAVASRTKSIASAYQMLHFLELDSCIIYKEIYPLNKRVHFHHIRAKSRAPFENMLFFDDDKRNLCEAATLHVTAVQVPPGGITQQLLMDGLRAFVQSKNC